MGTLYTTVMVDVWIQYIVYSSSGITFNVLFTESLNSYYVRILSSQRKKTRHKNEKLIIQNFSLANAMYSIGLFSDIDLTKILKERI